jgi:hypothetical protein
MKNLQLNSEELAVLQVSLLSTIEKWQEFDQEDSFWPKKVQVLRDIYERTKQLNFFEY